MRTAVILDRRTQADLTSELSSSHLNIATGLEEATLLEEASQQPAIEAEEAEARKMKNA